MATPIEAEDYANPISQVFFRAGLLACRETMARFVEQGGDHATAASIRANWWPQLGPDPGAPRKLAFDEVAVDNERGGWDMNPALTASIEALPVALGFLCQSPAFDPGPAPETRFVKCEHCGGEGRIERGHPNAPHPASVETCPGCTGEGVVEVAVQPTR